MHIDVSLNFLKQFSWNAPKDLMKLTKRKMLLVITVLRRLRFCEYKFRVSRHIKVAQSLSKRSQMRIVWRKEDIWKLWSCIFDAENTACMDCSVFERYGANYLIKMKCISLMFFSIFHQHTDILVIEDRRTKLQRGSNDESNDESRHKSPSSAF